MFRRSEKKNLIRQRITFYGTVQSVGFRYRAQYAAKLYDATGWVRNEPDGSVTMEIQGSEAAIDMVVQSLKYDDYIQIDRMECRTIPTEDSEYRFRVTY